MRRSHCGKRVGRRGEHLHARQACTRSAIAALSYLGARVGPTAELELLVKVLHAHGVVQQRALGQVRAPPVVRDPLGLLPDDLEDVLERVGARVRAQAGVEAGAGLEVVPLDLPLVRCAARSVVALADADAEARGRDDCGRGKASDARTDDHDIVLLNDRRGRAHGAAPPAEPGARRRSERAPADHRR